MHRSLGVLLAFTLILGTFSDRTVGQELVLSVGDDTGTQLGGLTFTDGDVVQYDAGDDTAAVLFAEGNISPDADVDAFHRFPDGSMLLSTVASGRTLAGFTFNDGDLIRYYPGTSNASIYFISESSFAVTADIDAVSIDANGNIVLSTLAGNTLGGLTYTAGDLISYDPNSSLATLLVAEADLFDDGSGNISGVHVMEDGTYLLSFTGTAETISGTAFNDGDVVHYDPVGDTATLFFAESLFTDGVNPHDVDAVYLTTPAPSAGAGLTLYLSDNNNIGNQLGDLTFTDGDVITYDVDTETAALFFAETNIAPSADIDAFHLFEDGSFLLSVLFNGRTLGGLTFDDGDLVRYDPSTDTASIYFLSEASFTTANPDISAVSIAPDGKILLSVRELTNTLAGLTFGDGDLISYETGSGVAKIVIPEADIFDDGDGDINSIHAFANGTYLLSFTDTTEMISGTLFNDGDVVLYDPDADTATLILSESQFLDGSTSHEIDAIYALQVGDCNFNGGIDLNDYTSGAACLLGPEAALPQDCACFDFDKDGDVDLEDFSLYAVALAG